MKADKKVYRNMLSILVEMISEAAEQREGSKQSRRELNNSLLLLIIIYVGWLAHFRDEVFSIILLS